MSNLETYMKHERHHLMVVRKHYNLEQQLIDIYWVISMKFNLLVKILFFLIYRNKIKWYMFSRTLLRTKEHMHTNLDVNTVFKFHLHLPKDSCMIRVLFWWPYFKICSLMLSKFQGQPLDGNWWWINRILV